VLFPAAAGPSIAITTRRRLLLIGLNHLLKQDFGFRISKRGFRISDFGWLCECRKRWRLTSVADFQQAATQAKFARALFQQLSAELLEYQKNIATAKQLPDPKRLQELDSRKEAIRREAMFQMQRAMPRQAWTALQTHLNQVFVKP